MKLFLGVDGGQSGTTALVGDETGRVIGVGRSGPCNHVATEQGRTRFLTSLSAAVAQAGGDVFESACFGFSGGPADKEVLTREIVRSARYLVTNDAVTALAGATAGGPGIIVIAGTGSIAYGRNERGETARAGGWGYIFGDEGGAFDIVRQALRAALRMEEGWGPSTTLRECFVAAAGARDADDLLHRFYTDAYPRARVAAMASLVDECASDGDVVAAAILDASAASLAELVAAVSNQIGDGGSVHYIGGVFRCERVLSGLRKLVSMPVAPPKYGPAAGALLEAYRIAGLVVALSNVPEEK